jgi:sugar lactone lactonase YvrE/enterochelin esterase-like enzyme
MNHIKPFLVSLLLTATSAVAQTRPTTTQSAVPKGEVKQYTFSNSKIFPTTVRDYWVYIPKQYDGTRPACVYVNQDGVQFNAPAVFDRLIAQGAMPVTVAIFVKHGRVPATQPNAALDRFNRSFEYDGLGDNYARFLLEEFLPYVEQTHGLKLSHDPNDRAIGGSSSGAICAFTAAWERPDAFHRVFSSIGTYVGLRGGNEYANLLRKVEPKPLRIFLEDGSNDLNHYGGDWWMQNQTMERALTFAGYEVNHAWGDGGHNGKHATEIFPDAMRWLWKDWPQPVKPGAGSEKLQDILLPGQEWVEVGGPYQRTDGPAANSKGEVFFNDPATGKAYRISPDGNATVVRDDVKKMGGQAFGPDGRLYTTDGATSRILTRTADAAAPTVLADGIKANDLVVRHTGDVYVTEPPADPSAPGRVWLVRPNGEKRVVDEHGAKFPNGITLSPDQSLLYVGDYRSRWVWCYQIQSDGSLAAGQKFDHLYVPDTADDSGADGMKTDRDGRLYVATRLGVQVCDQAGRVLCIIPTPNAKCSNLTFGGPAHDTLFVTSGDKVFKRKLKVKGAQAWDTPTLPAAPKL